MPYILNWWRIYKETRPLFNNLSFYLDDSLRDKVGLEKAIRAYNGKIFPNIEFQAPFNIFILGDGSPLIENVIGAYSTEVKNEVITNQKVNVLSLRWIWSV